MKAEWLWSTTAQNEADAAGQAFGVKANDAEYCQYLRISGMVKEEHPEADKLDRRWRIAEIILSGNSSPIRMNLQLGFVGMSLADFLLVSYNNEQVARDSDGLNNLDNVA